MMKEKHNERMSDAKQLTEDVQGIIAEINLLKKEYEIQIAPLTQKISTLEEIFLDKWLVDSTGIPVRKGMILEKEGKQFKVLDRYQQIVMEYLGNARVSVLPVGKKRTVDISSSELVEYTIVEPS